MQSVLKMATRFERILKLADNTRTLYHISKHGPAKPVPKLYKLPYRSFDPGIRKEISRSKKEIKELEKQEPRTGWERPWLKEQIYSGVFLTDEPMAVWKYHGKKGTVHVYKVKERIIKDSGGLHRFDWAKEVLIPEHLWNDGISSGDIKYIGAISSDKFKELAEEKTFGFGPPPIFKNTEELAKQVADTNPAAKAYLQLLPKVRELRLKNKISIAEAKIILNGLKEFFEIPPYGELKQTIPISLAISNAFEMFKIYTQN